MLIYSEITCLMDLYIVINVCFLVVVFYRKRGGGYCKKVVLFRIRFCFVCLSLRKKEFYFKKNNFRMYIN